MIIALLILVTRYMFILKGIAIGFTALFIVITALSLYNIRWKRKAHWFLYNNKNS